MSLDVAQEAVIAKGANGIVAQLGCLDVVNTAYFNTSTAIDETTAQERALRMRVTLTGAFVVGRECARISRPAMRPSRRSPLGLRGGSAHSGLARAFTAWRCRWPTPCDWF